MHCRLQRIRVGYAQFVNAYPHHTDDRMPTHDACAATQRASEPRLQPLAYAEQEHLRCMLGILFGAVIGLAIWVAILCAVTLLSR